MAQLIENTQAEIDLLTAPYQSLALQKNWTAYQDALETDALIWWFDQDIERIVSHLAPLSAAGFDTPFRPRIQFLIQSLDPAIGIDQIQEKYCRFIETADFEAAAAAACAGVCWIWYQGENFRLFKDWRKRIRRIVRQAPDLSPSAMAALLFFQGIAVVLGKADLPHSDSLFKAAMDYAEKARSPSLTIIIATCLMMNHLHQAWLTKMELLFFDTQPLMTLPQISPTARLQFCMLEYLYHFFCTNDMQKAEAALQKALDDPLFSIAPPVVYFFSYIPQSGKIFEESLF